MCNSMFAQDRVCYPGHLEDPLELSSQNNGICLINLHSWRFVNLKTPNKSRYLIAFYLVLKYPSFDVV